MQKKIIFLILLISSSSCRLDTESLTTVDTLARNIPNIVIEQITYKEMEYNQLTREVYADELQIFSQEDLVLVARGRVKTYRNGDELLSGEAASAQYNQNTEDANVLGPIEVYYYPEKTRVAAQKLNWFNSERRLNSTPEGLVEVSQDNGTKFQGRDFSVDMATKTVSYSAKVTGTLYAGQEDSADLAPLSNLNFEPQDGTSAEEAVRAVGKSG